MQPKCVMVRANSAGRADSAEGAESKIGQVQRERPPLNSLARDLPAVRPAPIVTSVDTSGATARGPASRETLLQDVLALDGETTNFKTLSDLPISRVKRIVKTTESELMVGAETPVLLARAVEMLIHDLTKVAWEASEGAKRKTLLRGDICNAAMQVPEFDCILDVVDGTLKAERTVALQARAIQARMQQQEAAPCASEVSFTPAYAPGLEAWAKKQSRCASHAALLAAAAHSDVAFIPTVAEWAHVFD